MVRHAWLRSAALEVVHASLADSVAGADLVAVLEALDPRFFGLIGDLIPEPLEPACAVARGAAVVLQVASIQLADDLADAECSYLEAPARQGPGAQALLQVLAMRCMLDAKLSPETLARVLDDLVAVGAAQQFEVRRDRWDAASYLQLARDINGRQHAAYLALLRDAGQDPELREVGIAFGTCTHVVGDAITDDARWTSLSAGDRRAIAEHALDAHAIARAGKVPALRPHLDRIGDILTSLRAGSQIAVRPSR